MKIFILLILYFGVHLSADTFEATTHHNDEKGEKQFGILLKEKGEFIRVALVTNPKLRSNMPFNFKHVVIKIDGKILYNVHVGEFLSWRQTFDFYYKYTNIPQSVEAIIYNKQGEKLRIFDTIDNWNKKRWFVRQDALKIKSKETSFNKKYKDILQTKSPEEAILKLYGSQKAIPNVLQVKSPEVVENSSSVPVSINSPIEIESLALLENSNPRSVIAVWDITKGAIVKKYAFSFKMNCNNGCNTKITAMAKGRDGKLYKTVKPIHLYAASHTSCCYGYVGP